jgi:tetratricopeptide (TPR) repeat protein
MRFAVTILSDGTNPHVEAFREVAESIDASLRELGHDSLVVLGRPPVGRRAIVLGAQHAVALGWELPPDAIVYNLEQVGSGWFPPDVVELFNRHEVWEYSAINASRYGEVGLRPPAAIVHVGFHPSQLKMPRVLTPNYDVAFAGALNARREAVLNGLETRGLKVLRVPFGVYGAERDALMASAKVALNVHYYDAAIFEAPRVLWALHNGWRVVSEFSAGDEDNVAFDAGAVLSGYEALADWCAQLCDDAYLQSAVDHCEPVPSMTATIAAALGRPRLVLVMVCQDEDATIGRAIDSALPHIGAWSISFNGRGATTPRIIQEKLGHLPGALHRRPWMSYGHNRGEALALAAPYGTYGLILDADEVLEDVLPGAFVGIETSDVWEVEERMGELRYPKVRVVRLGLPWKYNGDVHELLDTSAASVGSLAKQAAIRNLRDGAASKEPPTERYAREAKQLVARLEKDPTDARAWHYLAQSLELAGLTRDAVTAYERRAALPGGFDEEAWLALLRIARIYERSGVADDRVPAAFLRAWQARPQRAEPLVALARWHRFRGDYALAYLYAQHAACIPRPPDRLCVEASVYEWQAADELAIAAYWVGNYELCAAECFRLLDVAPPDQRARIRENQRLAEEKLAAAKCLD